MVVHRIDPVRHGLNAIGVYAVGPGADWVQMMTPTNVE